uniref:Uncharacterized protein n=1 Tax=Chromera velia CCMP2878 TaxID=1169474 RepID=A0A0G4G8M7_9ALVE|eukprot:Cvel_20760.t1-p1 / transcript=Cvel_20760.t1 / gene=Cvel_20760 / organism=Chromera_velia_CCMP2878 / gene_product=hypothetical protein / transcript_product=hypothetical protein / location=Cvel_scaffold1892:23604-24591(-) / protein_length=270 / sequence_SO=supercontig / SO=protein_coding / is_pseudo=false
MATQTALLLFCSLVLLSSGLELLTKNRTKAALPDRSHQSGLKSASEWTCVDDKIDDRLRPTGLEARLETKEKRREWSEFKVNNLYSGCLRLELPTENFVNELFRKVSDLSGASFSYCQLFHAHAYTKDKDIAIIFHNFEFCPPNRKDFVDECGESPYIDRSECAETWWNLNSEALLQGCSSGCSAEDSGKHLMVWSSRDKKICYFPSISARLAALAQHNFKPDLLPPTVAGGLYLPHIWREELDPERSTRWDLNLDITDDTTPYKKIYAC